MTKTHALAALALAATAAPAIAQPADDWRAAGWTGAYAGGRIGYSWQPRDANEQLNFDTNLDGRAGDTVRTAAGANAFSPGFCGGAATTGVPAGGCQRDKDALTYAGMVGFDYQIGRSIVVGVVGEYGNANINDSVSGFSTTPASYTVTRSLRGTGAARGRLGYARGDTLLYGTGGLAYGKVRSRFGTTNNANAFVNEDGSDARTRSVKDDRWGYVVGGGIEQRVSRHFSIGALYTFTSLKDSGYSVRVARGAAPATNPFLLANADGTDLSRGHSRFVRHELGVTAAYRF